MKHFSILFFLIFFIFQGCEITPKDILDFGSDDHGELKRYYWINEFQVIFNGQPCLNANINVYDWAGGLQSINHADDLGKICCSYWVDRGEGYIVVSNMYAHCIIYADHDNPNSKSRDDTLRFIPSDTCPDSATIINLDI
jgi:hypothetical protein